MRLGTDDRTQTNAAWPTANPAATPVSCSPEATWQALLFDLDGTLVDSYPAITQSANHVRVLHGLPPLTPTVIRGFVGNGLHHLLIHAVPAGELLENAAAFEKHHVTVLETGTDVYPEVFDTLRELQQRGYPLGICSNKPLALTNRVLAAMGLTPFFRTVFGPERVSHRKPAPDMLLAACAELQVEPANTLYVGDMTIDIQTARAAGVPVWVIPTGSHSTAVLREANPDRVMNQFSELLTACPPRR